MNEKEILREAMKVRGYNQTVLAKAANLKRQTNVSEMLRGSTIQVKNFLKLLNVMQFDVVIRDRNSTNRTEWVLTPSEQPRERLDSKREEILSVLDEE